MTAIRREAYSPTSTDDAWLCELTAAETNEIDAAIDACRGSSLLEVGLDQFRLDHVGPRLNRIARSIEHRPGFAVIRGFPVEGRSEDEARLMAWGIGLYIGVPLAQRADGTVIVDVRADPHASSELRGHSSNRAVGFHVDSSDVFTLLCLRNSTDGGMSVVADSDDVRDELSWAAPELLAELYSEDIPFAALSSRSGQLPNVFRCPVFGRRDGWHTCRYYRARIMMAHSHPDVGPMSSLRRAAVDLVEEIAGSKAIRQEFRLAPGDLQLVNNHQVLHARTAFRDEVGGPKRHLLRTWYSVPWSRVLPETFVHAWGSTQPGTLRGSVPDWQLRGELGRFQRRQARQLSVIIPGTYSGTS